MIDNFNLISNLLTFNSDDEFYFVQIIQRKKDNPDTKGRNNNNRLIRSYMIKNIDQYFGLKDEMIKLANVFNARVGINLNKRSFEKTAFNTLKKIADCMHNRDFKNVKNAWNSSCGIHNSVDDKRWIVDIDGGDQVRKINLYAVHINDHCPPYGNKIISVIPSKSGEHLITKPFDVISFTNAFDDVEIHKNNPTNLYIP